MINNFTDISNDQLMNIEGGANLGGIVNGIARIIKIISDVNINYPEDVPINYFPGI